MSLIVFVIFMDRIHRQDSQWWESLRLGELRTASLFFAADVVLLHSLVRFTAEGEAAGDEAYHLLVKKHGSQQETDGSSTPGWE